MFELIRDSDGGWTEKDLAVFDAEGSDGPVGGVTFDAAGRLYGVTSRNGKYGFGSVFQLVRNPAGGWTTNLIYNFQGYPADGGQPQAGLTIDAQGNIFGTTKNGGSGSCTPQLGTYLGCGTVFELSYTPATGWTETVLYSFQGPHMKDGATPLARVILDQGGNLYGTTLSGGLSPTVCTSYYPKGCGTVFELSPSTGGGWSEKILYEFKGRYTDGSNPDGPVIRDSSGNLYGATIDGGSYVSGTLFKLMPDGAGGWTQSVLYSFGAAAHDGEFPEGALAFDAAGNIFGTTAGGGNPGGASNNGQGTVFEFTP